MEPEGLLPCSQEPASVLYLEPDESTPPPQPISPSSILMTIGGTLSNSHEGMSKNCWNLDGPQFSARSEVTERHSGYHVRVTRSSGSNYESLLSCGDFQSYSSCLDSVNL
jgi:hypothetical protein